MAHPNSPTSTGPQLLLLILLGLSLSDISSGKVINIFGDGGWVTPTNGPIWQAPRAYPGDVLNFTYIPSGLGYHNVWQLANKNAYRNCDFTGAVFLGNSTKLLIRVNRHGRFFFACRAVAESSHCELGQKVTIGVYHPIGGNIVEKSLLEDTNAVAPTPRAGTTKVVSVFGSTGWTVPPPGFKWTPPEIHAGDRLNFSTPPGDTTTGWVYQMDSFLAWKSCNFSNSIEIGQGPVVIGMLPKSGTFFYAGQASDCKAGLKIGIRVLPRIRSGKIVDALTVMTPHNTIPLPPTLPIFSPVFSPTLPTTTKPQPVIQHPLVTPTPKQQVPKKGVPRVRPAPKGKVINVFGSMGWRVPPAGFNWVQPIIKVGDSLNFTYASLGPTYFHNVWQLKDIAAYQTCNFAQAVLVGNSSTVIIKMLQPGTKYYACSVLGFHCILGQKVAITVGA